MLGVRRLLAVLLLSLAGAPTVSGQVATQTILDQELDLKAAFLYNFGHYVQWPALGPQFTIGILGKDPFGERTQEIEKRSIAERAVVVRRFASMEEYQPCQILFVSPLAADGRPNETATVRLQAAVQQLKGKPVLLVSELPDGARQGAMINFVVDIAQNRLRMEINSDVAKNEGLVISSRLLGLSVVNSVR